MNKIFWTMTVTGLWSLLGLQSCSMSEGPRKIFSRPSGKIPLNSDKHSVTLTIFSNHGLQKGLYPKEEPAPLNSPRGFPRALRVGGVEILSRYLHLIKRKFNDRALILDAGNTFQHSDDLRELTTRLKIVEKLPFDSILLSGDDYLFQSLLQKENTYQIPFLNSNILDLRTQRPIQTNNLFSSQIIERSGVKIGLIGLIDIQSFPIEKQKQFNGVYFQDLVAALLKFRNHLQNEGAQILILMAHIPTHCQSEVLYRSRKGDKIPSLKCPKKDPLEQFIKRLPQNSVDLIVLSGKRLDTSSGSGRIKEFLILNEPTNGHYLGQVSLSYNRQQEKILFKESTLHPRIKTCHKFFASTLDCHIHEQDRKERRDRQRMMKHDAYALIPAQFLGFEIQADTMISTILSDK